MKKILFLCMLAAILMAHSCKTAEKAAATNDNQPLCETQWVLTHVNGKPVMESPAQPFILFSNDDKFTGCLGCNTFFGTYYVRKDKIDIHYTGSTKRLCSEMKTENDFSEALQNDASRFTINHNELIIKNKNQEILRFKAQKTE